MSLKNKTVIKASGAIQTANFGVASQRLLWNALLASAYDDLCRDIERNEDTEHEESLREVMECAGYTSKNIEHFKEQIRGLVCQRIEWNILGKDGEEWGVATALSSCEIFNGRIKWAYSKSLKKKLANPKIYAKVSMIVQSKLSGNKSAIALYELGLDFCDEKRGAGKSPWIKIEDFKGLLGIDKEAYPQYKFFSRDVIKPAITLVNKETHLLIDIKTKKVGRKIEFLKIVVMQVKKHDLPAQKSRDKEYVVEEEKKEIFEQICADPFICPKVKALEFCKEYSAEYLLDRINFTLAELEAGEIKSTVYGYFKGALEGNWQKSDPTKEAQKIKDTKRIEREKIAQFKAQQDAKNKEIIEIVSDEIYNFFNSLPESSEITTRFKENIKSSGMKETTLQGSPSIPFRGVLRGKIIDYIDENHHETMLEIFAEAAKSYKFIEKIERIDGNIQCKFKKS